ncbi:MAG: hypothetical protein ACREMK_12885 [Gemmatimonadota bacterium]
MSQRQSFAWFRSRALSGLVGTAAVLSGACGADGPAPGHVVLDGTLSTLREAFNADSGKVRAILLASPT